LQVISPKASSILGQLDAGEGEAIALASELHSDVLLIDDYAGRQEARRLQLKVAGTVSVLDEADRVGLLNFEHAMAELRKTSFRIAQSVVAEIVRKRLR
jgi:predicted nucleic acid-binding protein